MKKKSTYLLTINQTYTQAESGKDRGGGYAQDRKGEKRFIFEIVIPFVDIFRVEIIKNY